MGGSLEQPQNNGWPRLLLSPGCGSMPACGPSLHIIDWALAFNGQLVTGTPSERQGVSLPPQAPLACGW